FTYTANACGLTSTCKRTFTWTVTTTPVFDNITDGTTDLGCNPRTLPTADYSIMAHNECGSVPVTCTPGAVQSSGCQQSQSFTYTATACGLTKTCKRIFVWTVDTTGPTFVGCVNQAANLQLVVTNAQTCITSS